MAFEALRFSRDWNNPADFPTTELDEAVVRADLQSLHDETKAYLNENLVPKLTEELEYRAT